MGYFTELFLFNIFMEYCVSLGFSFREICPNIFEIDYQNQTITRAVKCENACLGDYIDPLKSIIKANKDFDIGTLLSLFNNT